MNLQEIQAVMDKAAVKTRAVRETLLIENPADILKAAAAMKGAGFNFLSSVTAADYLQFLECVYHFDDLSQKGRSAVLRARVPRDSAKLPSVTPVYRGAEYQEREAYDTYGIIFDGHNDLRRIFMWDGFEGFPLRKDYQQEDSETLEAADVEWLAKHNVKVPDEMKKKAEELKQQGKRALAQKPGQPEPA